MCLMASEPMFFALGADFEFGGQGFESLPRATKHLRE